MTNLEKYRAARDKFVNAMKKTTVKTTAGEEKPRGLAAALDAAKGKEAMTKAHKAFNDHIPIFIKRLETAYGSTAGMTNEESKAYRTFDTELKSIASTYHSTIK